MRNIPGTTCETLHGARRSWNRRAGITMEAADPRKAVRQPPKPGPVGTMRPLAGTAAVGRWLQLLRGLKTMLLRIPERFERLPCATSMELRAKHSTEPDDHGIGTRGSLWRRQIPAKQSADLPNPEPWAPCGHWLALLQWAAGSSSWGGGKQCS